VRQWIVRGVLLAAAGVSLYLLAPGLIDIFGSWHELKNLEPWWYAAAALFVAASFVSLWEVQRIALRTPSWFAVGTSQLVGNAMGSLIPGGGATASAFSYRYLVRAGVSPSSVGAGMAAAFVASTSAVLALPVLAVPAIVGGVAAPKGLLQTAYVGVAAFALVVAVGAAAMLSDKPVLWAGRAARWAMSHTPKHAPPDLPQRLLAQRDQVRDAFGDRWFFGVCSAVGKWGFLYASLVCVLAALGSRPNPSLVLLAFTAGSLLGMIPLTPGGLGFVEAGLVGTLTLAGVSAQDAVLATLTYRLVSYWLPIPAGGVAYAAFRRRHP
jgi:uncharacterized protein (TIRG00374 family)